MNYTCRICGKQDNTEKYIIKEMMFGTKEEFEYFKCSTCGCLQIKEIPDNMGKYYPSDYYSFNIKKKSKFIDYLKDKRDYFSYYHKSFIGRILVKFYGYSDIYYWLPNVNIKKDDFILDVGSGAGELLLRLKKLGFTNLMGIDPYLKEDIFYKNFFVSKKDLSQVNQVFDFVMFHHVFEHLADPHEIFLKLKNVVRKGGLVLIRIPVVDSFAWEHYGVNWAQLDSPRHYFLHTTKSISFLAKRYNFNIDKIIYDSNSFQFWASEQYKSGIPLIDKNSYYLNKKGSVFTKKDIRRYNQKATELNKSGKGDAACFILQNLG